MSNEKLSFSPRTLLIVDDDSQIRDILKVQLSSLVDEIFEAEDGKQALELVEKHDFTCICTDFRMANKDGLELLREIFALKPSTPVILITGWGDPEVVKAAFRLGAFDFIEKPYKTAEIREVLGRALEIGKRRALFEKELNEIQQNEQVPEQLKNDLKKNHNMIHLMQLYNADKRKKS